VRYLIVPLLFLVACDREVARAKLRFMPGTLDIACAEQTSLATSNGDDPCLSFWIRKLVERGPVQVKVTLDEGFVSAEALPFDEKP
jgi:hypothetical protein